MIFCCEGARIGTLALFPIRKKIDAEGQPYPMPGLRLIFDPAWKPGTAMNDAGDLVQSKEGNGPDMIDTEDMKPDNLRACIEYWGEGWKKELTEWLRNEGKALYGFTEKDPRPEQKVTVTLTREQFARMSKGDKTAPSLEVKAKPSITSGAKTVGK